MKDFRFAAGGDHMPSLMGRRLRPALARVVGIEQHAWTQCSVIRKQTRYLAVEPAHIDADAKFQFEQRDDVRNGTDPCTQSLPEFRCVLFGLRAHIAAQDWTFSRIVSHPPYA